MWKNGSIPRPSPHARAPVRSEREECPGMGKLIYEGGQKVEIEDRALTHLQLVITAKLRRGEPFAFTWREDSSVGGGRTTVWVHAGSSIVFRYAGSRQPSINRAWVDALAHTANAPSGLYLVHEPSADSTAARQDDKATA